MKDPEFPEGVAIFGTDGDEDTCSMLNFDTHAVARRYDVAFYADGFTWSRDSQKFAQRFRVTIADDGRTMESEGTMKKDGGPWEPDLCLSYAREGTYSSKKTSLAEIPSGPAVADRARTT